MKRYKLHSATGAIALAAVAAFAAPAHAQTAAPAADAKEPPPYTIATNFGIYSQYVFRGLTQTDQKPAFQGGFDLTTTSGFYAGTWGSNISWLHDAGVVNHGASLEWDLYGGYRYSFTPDWGIDVGALYYYYPGSYVDGVTKPDSTELYVAGSWKWASLKYSHAVSNLFGVPDSHNSWYLDLSANYPLTDTLTLNAHVGRQEFKGQTAGINNGDNLNYTDWKLGLTYSVNNWNVGAYYTDTNAKDAGYTLAGRNIGKATGTVFIQRTF
ncbi:MAG: TorF family putative porin [Candidatus Levyibacteriota bacterium]